MSTVDLTPLTRGLAVLDHLPDDLARLGDAELSDLLGSLLRLRAKTEGAALAVLMEAEQRGVVAASTAVDAGAWLRGVAQDADVVISGAEGRGWREVAGTCGRPDMTVLSDAVTSGRLSVASAATLAKDLRQVRSHVPAVTWDACLGEFVDYAAAGASPKRLAQLRERVIDQYGEGDEPQRRERLAFERRGLTPFRPDGYGGGVATWTLDAASIAVVEAAMDALAAPNPGRYANTDDCCADHPDNGCVDPADKAAFDSRTVSQRRADALVELCQVIATNPGELGGIRPTSAARAQVVITIDYDRLVDQLRDHHGQGHGRRYGTTLHGDPLSPTTIRQLACDAELIPMVLGSQGEVLDQGRAVRLATPGQLAYLRQRDRGCSFPGCDRPPSWTQAHHVSHWLDGGETDVGNLALLCRRHHTIVHRDHLTARIDPTGATWLPPAAATQPRRPA